jgi:hypothetical protein
VTNVPFSLVKAWQQCAARPHSGTPDCIQQQPPPPTPQASLREQTPLHAHLSHPFLSHLLLLCRAYCSAKHVFPPRRPRAVSQQRPRIQQPRSSRTSATIRPKRHNRLLATRAWHAAPSIDISGTRLPRAPRRQVPVARGASPLTGSATGAASESTRRRDGQFRNARARPSV